MKTVKLGVFLLLMAFTANLNADFRNYYNSYNRNLPGQISSQDTTNSNSDYELRQKIRSALYNLPEARGVSIDVTNGNVTLQGSVKTDEDLRRIEAKINTVQVLLASSIKSKSAELISNKLIGLVFIQYNIG
jgi:hypothetical protein